MPRVHLPPPKQVLAPTWTEADSMLEQLTDRARSVRRTATIARFTGLRCSQAAATTWADFSVDWEGRGPALHVRVTKTEQEAALNRWVPLAPALAHRLLQWKMLDGRPGDDALIIGAPLPRDPGDTVGAAWSRAGVPEDRWRKRPFHSLRKRFLSHMVEAGVSDAAIDYLVGHVPKGVRARHYVDPRALWPAMKQAVATIPDIGEGPEATPSFPHASLQVP